MSGLIDAKNGLLKQAEQQVLARVQPGMRQNVDKITISISKLALHKGTAGLLSHLKTSPDPVKTIVEGAIAIVLLLRRESSGTMPAAALVPAAMVAILHGLDFAQKAGIMKTVTPDDIDRATHMFTDEITSKLGITPQGMQAMASHAHAVMQDPAKTAQMQSHFGSPNGNT